MSRNSSKPVPRLPGPVPRYGAVFGTDFHRRCPRLKPRSERQIGVRGNVCGAFWWCAGRSSVRARCAGQFLGVPTRHTHKSDGLHTRHPLERTHTHTNKHTGEYTSASTKYISTRGPEMGKRARTAGEIAKSRPNIPAAKWGFTARTFGRFKQMRGGVEKHRFLRVYPRGVHHANPV